MATDGLHWTIAIALYLFGSFLAAMGINSMKLALDRDEEARAAGKTEPLLSDGSSASDSTSGGGGGGYGTLESGGDEELLGGSAPVVKPSAFEAAKATVRVALLPRRDRCRCCCASAYDCLDAQAGAVLDVVMWLLRLFPMLWYVGLGSLLMGQVFVFPSFSLANQSVLCTLGSVQFPLNLLFVVIVLKARPPIISWIGVVLIVVGDSLVVGFSKNKDVELGVDELQALWTYGGITASEATFNPLTNTTMKEHIPGNPHNIVYLCFLFSVGVLCFILPAVYQIVVPTSPTLVKLCVGDAVPSDAIKATLAKSNVVGFFFALASAIFGSQCMTFVKSVMEVVTLSLFPKKGTAANFEGLTHAYFYLCILVVLVTGIWWGIRLQLALARFNQVFIVSMMQVSWTLTTVMDGGMYFQEFDDFEAINYIAFIGGLALILIGVLLLGVGGDGLEVTGTSTSPLGDEDGGKLDRSISLQKTKEGSGGSGDDDDEEEEEE